MSQTLSELWESAGQRSGADTRPEGHEGKKPERVLEDERDQTIRYLAKELAESGEESRRRSREHQILQEQHCKLKQAYDEARECIRGLRTQKGQLKQSSDKPQQTVNEQNSDIADPTQRINDDYFKEEFTKLAGAIQQWVFRYFRGPSSIKWGDFGSLVQESLKYTILRDDSLEEPPEVKIKELQAVVADQLFRYVFCWSQFWVPQLQEPGCDFGSARDSFGGTDLERREWHSQTINTLIKENRYEDHLHKGVEAMTKYLISFLDIRATGGSKEHREQALSAIVEHAARLSEKLCQQSPILELRRIYPGYLYHPDSMEDISGILEDEETEEMEETEETVSYIVQKVIFPGLFRHEAGKGVVVRKATVLVVRS